MPFPPSFDARVVSARALTPGVRELTFERIDGAPMAFEPGQWVNVLLPVGTPEAEVKRSYSIASAPAGSPRFDVAVTRVQGGPGSTFLHDVQPGATLRFIGPQGFFTRPATGGPPSLMIATGTGVTPMRSMLDAALAAASTAPVWILLGVRHEQDLLYADELQRAAAAHPFVRFEPTLSQPGPAWHGRKGYVQTHVRELWDGLCALGAGLPHAYICGLERMVGSVRELLRKDLELPRQQVHSERYD
jgi:CDP-4-dehydro-6-deoxyglucose reductase